MSSASVFVISNGRVYVDAETIVENLCQFGVNMLTDDSSPVPISHRVFFGIAAEEWVNYILSEAELAMLDPDTVIV